MRQGERMGMGGGGEAGEGLFPGNLLNNLATLHHPVGSFFFPFFILEKEKKKSEGSQKRLHGAKSGSTAPAAGFLRPLHSAGSHIKDSTFNCFLHIAARSLLCSRCKRVGVFFGSAARWVVGGGVRGAITGSGECLRETARTPRGARAAPPKTTTS